MDSTDAPELMDAKRLKAINSVNELFNGFINRFAETDCTTLTGAYSDQIVHPFRTIPSTRSEGNHPVIPKLTVQVVRV